MRPLFGNQDVQRDTSGRMMERVQVVYPFLYNLACVNFSDFARAVKNIPRRYELLWLEVSG